MNTEDRKDPHSPERDATLEQAWHQASNEQPSSRLDAAIIDAAHEAVGNRVARPQIVRTRSPSWLTQWQPVAAAAAVTGLAFVLVQMLPRDRGGAPTMQIEAPAVDAEPQVLRDPPVRSETEGISDAGKPNAGAVMERSKRVAPAPAAAPPAASDRQSPNSVYRNEDVSEGTPAAEVDQRDAAASNAPTAAVSAGMGAPTGAAKQSTAASVSAADWAARVTAQYESGETARAADTLRAFRAAYPDAEEYLPETLRHWAQAIK